MVPMAHPGKIALPGASWIAGEGGLHPALAQPQTSQWKAQHHQPSSPAHPALQPTATLTAAPKGSASETAELTHLTLLK